MRQIDRVHQYDREINELVDTYYQEHGKEPSKLTMSPEYYDKFVDMLGPLRPKHIMTFRSIKEDIPIVLDENQTEPFKVL